MKDKPTVNIYKSLSTQQAIRDTLIPSSEGPVPEVCLYRLLSIVTSLVNEEVTRRNQLNSVCPKLIGLRLGYEFIDSSKNEIEETYSVEWGELPGSEASTANEEEDFDEQPELDLPENLISFNFASNVLKRVEEEMNRTASADLVTHNFRPFLYGNLNQNFINLRVKDCFCRKGDKLYPRICMDNKCYCDFNAPSCGTVREQQPED